MRGVARSAIAYNEDIESEILANYLRAQELHFTHIANERITSVARGAKLKRMGLSKGFPDVMIALSKDKSKDGKDYLIFIELKKITERNRKQKPEQVRWINRLNKMSHVHAKICFGSVEAIAFVGKLLKGEL